MNTQRESCSDEKKELGALKKLLVLKNFPNSQTSRAEAPLFVPLSPVSCELGDFGAFPHL